MKIADSYDGFDQYSYSTNNRPLNDRCLTSIACFRSVFRSKIDHGWVRDFTAQFFTVAVHVALILKHGSAPSHVQFYTILGCSWYTALGLHTRQILYPVPLHAAAALSSPTPPLSLLSRVCSQLLPFVLLQAFDTR